jgi:glycosyltransferase involved in cell wall biosynthesis
MHFGKPVFLSRLTSLPEIGGEEAFYFESFEPTHMQSVLEKALLLHDENKERALKKRASEFEWLHTASQYLQLYKSII